MLFVVLLLLLKPLLLEMDITITYYIVITYYNYDTDNSVITGNISIESEFRLPLMPNNVQK